jgi:hypothetical protein
MKFYIFWETREIVSEEEIKEKIKRTYPMEDWLQANYTSEDIFWFGEDMKNEVLDNFINESIDIAILNEECTILDASD